MGLTVPRYEQPQIKSGGVGGVASAPEIHPIADKLSSGMGRLGGFIGGVVEKAVEKAVENADNAAMDEAKISILGAKNQLSVEMKQVKGKAVEEGKAFDGGDDDGSPNLTTHYLSEYDDRVKAATEKLNPALQERMKTFIGTHKVSFEGDLLTHESGEREKYQLADKMQLHDTAKESAALELRNKGFLSPETLEEVKTSAADIATRTGKETPEMARKGAESGVYTEHITFLIGNQNKVAAVNQFNAYKDKIEAKDYDRLNPHIEVFKGDLAGDTVAGSVFGSLTPKTINDKIDVDAMRKQVEALKVGDSVEVPGLGKVKVNDEAKKRAGMKVEEMARELSAGRKAGEDAFNDTLWQMIDNKQLNKTSAMTAIKTSSALTGDYRVRLEKAVEHYFNPPKDPEAAMLKRIGQMEALADLQEQINNGTLRVKDLKDGLKYAPLIGRENVSKLVSHGTNYEKALANPSVTAGQFNEVMDELRASGVTIPKKDTPEYKAMRSTMLDSIVTTQTATGKMLDEDGVKTSFRKMATETVPVSARQTFAGIPLWKTTDEKKAWEVKNPEAIDVTAMLRKRLNGKEPSQAQIDEATRRLKVKEPKRRDVKNKVQFGGLE